MAIEKIEYQNKEAIDDVGVPEKNKVTAENMNEIKSVVNNNADEMEDADNALSSRIDEVSSAVNNIVENTYTKTETDEKLAQKADTSDIPTKLSDLENDEGFIDNTVNDLENYTLTQDLAEVATSGSYNDLSNTPTIPTKTSDLTNDSGFIDKNVNNLTNYTLKTNTGSLIDLEINQSNYVVSLKLKDIDGNVISSDNIDLPLESVVVGGSYDATNKKIVLTLENGNTVDIPVGDLIAGLQTEITSTNKLASDLVDDSNSGNKFTNTSEKNSWNAKYDKPSGGIPKTDMTTAVQTSLGKADTALQEHQDITGKEDKTNKVTSLSSSSTDKQYPSAKCVYDSQATQDDEIEALQTENARLKATLPTTTGEGQDITLDKTAEMEFVKPPLPRGNSEQEGEPSPDNEVPITNVTGNVEVTISNNDNSESKTLPVSLGDIELCKIGNCQDYLYKASNKWYLHKEIKKILLNGTENWSISNNVFFLINISDYINSSGKICLSDKYTAVNNTNAGTSAITQNNSICFFNTNTVPRLYIRDERFNNVNAFRDELSENNAKLYYPTVTPTDTEITDATLISQLEEISKTLSYQGQTNITSDTIALFDVEAYQDLKIMTTTSISSSSTDNEYPSAKAVYDYIQSLNGDEVSY